MQKVPQEPRYWASKVKSVDDFGKPIIDEFIDGKTRMGPWAIMSPESFKQYRMARDGSLGMGLGQRYKRQPDGRWLKVEG